MSNAPRRSVSARGFIVKRSGAGLDPPALAAGTMVAAMLLVAPPALATLPDELPSAGPVAAILALGVGGTGIAFAIFHTLIAEVGPARAMLVSYIAPGFAVAYGATLLGEPVTLATIAGLVLIVGGSWLGASRASAAPGPDGCPLRPPPPAANLSDRPFRPNPFVDAS